MTHDEIKAFIADRTREGHNLSKIQDMLAEQGVKMTFMELRLIASEIETSFWQKSEPQPEPAPEAEKPAQDAAPADEADELSSEPKCFCLKPNWLMTHLPLYRTLKLILWLN